MNRIAALPALFALMLTSTAAWACPVGPESELFFGLFLAPFLAIPFTLFATGVIAVQARQWFVRPVRGWLFATFGAWFAATVGGIAGIGIAYVATQAGIEARNVLTTIVLSTPFVFQVAYLMRLHSRRPTKA